VGEASKLMGSPAQQNMFKDPNDSGESECPPDVCAMLHELIAAVWNGRAVDWARAQREGDAVEESMAAEAA
jgi:hypothetical protein